MGARHRGLPNNEVSAVGCVPYKIVWVASMPRSGSMWAFNVARSLLRDAGLTVFPRDNRPRSDTQTVAEAQAALKDDSSSHIWCLKIHSRMTPAHANGFISTFRDPRDAIISYMRFVRCDFDRALSAAKVWTRLCDHYRGMSTEFSLCLDYDAIIREPINVASQIQAFLGLDSDADAIAKIVAKFAPESIRRRMEAVRNEIEHQRRVGKIDIADRVTINADGTQRIVDLETGFQSDHVSDYRPGGWRDVLTRDQKQCLDQAIGDWLTRNGYKGD